jgi:hypothetical protein
MGCNGSKAMTAVAPTENRALVTVNHSATYSRDLRPTDTQSKFSIAGDAAAVASTFDHSPFLRNAFNDSGKKFVSVPDGVADTLLSFSRVVFAPQSDVKCAGVLPSLRYAANCPTSWTTRVTTGADMGSLVDELAAMSPAIAEQLAGDTMEQRILQQAAYSRVEIGDLSESRSQTLTITTELLLASATTQQYCDYKLTTRRAVESSGGGNALLLPLDTTQQSVTIRCGDYAGDGDGDVGVSHIDALRVHSTANGGVHGSGCTHYYCVPTPGIGVCIVANWMGMATTDAGARGAAVAERVLQSLTLDLSST